MKRLAIFILFLGALNALGKSQVLPEKELTSFKSGNCVFYHFWATWCHPCLKELPILLKWLEARKFIQPVVVDLSSPFSQRQFSRKWVDEALKPSFATYLKPETEIHQYVHALDKSWTGALPYTILYHRGKRLEFWEGTLDFSVLATRIPKLCTEKPST